MARVNIDVVIANVSAAEIGVVCRFICDEICSELAGAMLMRVLRMIEGFARLTPSRGC